MSIMKVFGGVDKVRPKPGEGEVGGGRKRVKSPQILSFAWKSRYGPGWKNSCEDYLYYKYIPNLYE